MLHVVTASPWGRKQSLAGDIESAVQTRGRCFGIGGSMRAYETTPLMYIVRRERGAVRSITAERTVGWTH